MSGIRRISMPVTLVVKGPVVTRSSSIGAPGVDAPMAKCPIWNQAAGAFETRYYLPGRLVKGLLREAWCELGFAELTKWMGEVSPEKSYDDPRRSRIALSDFADLTTSAALSELRYRIEVDDTTGTAAGQMLQVIDSPYGPGQKVRFQGEIRFLAAESEDVDEVVRSLQRSLHWIRAVGGVRTAGFGEVVRVETGTVETGRPASCESPEGDWWQLRLTFRELAMFGNHKIARNLFESDDVLSGGAIKGAIAEMAGLAPDEYKDLLQQLHRVRFTHAFPARKETGGGEGVRPERWPLSLAALTGGEGRYDVFDAIRATGPVTRNGRAGAFEIDWKDEVGDEVARKFDWPEIDRELRVRTEIDGALGKANDDRLFVWQMLAPKEIEFRGFAEVGGVTAEARAQLAELLGFGIEFIGKTKARAEVVFGAAKMAEPEEAGRYRVVLQTPALLLHPESLQGATGEAEMKAAAERAWNALSDGALRLREYFQRTSLAGGTYLQNQFRGSRATYKPYLMTEAGSTFLLEAAPDREKEAAECLGKWVRRGLPLDGQLRQFYEIRGPEDQWWKQCGYLPENGYGEIVVNGRRRYEEWPEAPEEGRAE